MTRPDPDDEEVEVFVATEHYEATYDAAAVHPYGHVLSLSGQGHIPVRCDCERKP
jgi:hypothetical protein